MPKEEKQPCKHIKAILDLTKESKVSLGSCGCCDGVALECRECRSYVYGIKINEPNYNDHWSVKQ